MAIDTLQTLEVIEAMENFIAKNRPPEKIRDQVDLSYKIKASSCLKYGQGLTSQQKR